MNRLINVSLSSSWEETFSSTLIGEAIERTSSAHPYGHTRLFTQHCTGISCKFQQSWCKTPTTLTRHRSQLSNPPSFLPCIAGPLFNKCELKRVKFVSKAPFHLLGRAASYRPLVAALEPYSFKRVTDNIVSRLNILLLVLLSSSSLSFLVFHIQKRWSVLRHPKTLLHSKHTMKYLRDIL